MKKGNLTKFTVLQQLQHPGEPKPVKIHVHLHNLDCLKSQSGLILILVLACKNLNVVPESHCVTSGVKVESNQNQAEIWEQMRLVLMS